MKLLIILAILSPVIVPVIVFVVWNFCVGFKEGMQRVALTPEEQQDFINYVYGRLDGTIPKNAPIFRPKMRIIEPPEV